MDLGAGSWRGGPLEPREAESTTARCRSTPLWLREVVLFPGPFPRLWVRNPTNLSLVDGKRLSDYSIGPNSKLNLVVKPLEKVLLEEGAAGRLADSAPPPVWQLISKVLARHFSVADASRVLEQLQRVRRDIQSQLVPAPDCHSIPLPTGTP